MAVPSNPASQCGPGVGLCSPSSHNSLGGANIMSDMNFARCWNCNFNAIREPANRSSPSTIGPPRCRPMQLVFGLGLRLGKGTDWLRLEWRWRRPKDGGIWAGQVLQEAKEREGTPNTRTRRAKMMMKLPHEHMPSISEGWLRFNG